MHPELQAGPLQKSTMPCQYFQEEYCLQFIYSYKKQNWQCIATWLVDMYKKKEGKGSRMRGTTCTLSETMNMMKLAEHAGWWVHWTPAQIGVKHLAEQCGWWSWWPEVISRVIHCLILVLSIHIILHNNHAETSTANQPRVNYESTMD